jgi:hypothetical protein
MTKAIPVAAIAPGSEGIVASWSIPVELDPTPAVNGAEKSSGGATGVLESVVVAKAIGIEDAISPPNSCSNR